MLQINSSIETQIEIPVNQRSKGKKREEERQLFYRNETRESIQSVVSMGVDESHVQPSWVRSNPRAEKMEKSLEK